MKVSVDKGVALMQIALVEQLALFFASLVLVNLLKTFGMYTWQGYGHSTDIHDEPAVSGYADYITFESGIFTCHDAK